MPSEMPRETSSEADRQICRLVIDAAGDAVICIDLQFRIKLFNHEAERIFGYSAEEVMGRSLDLLLPVDARAGHETQMTGFARSASTAQKLMGSRSEIRGQRRDGSIFPAEASISKCEIDGELVFTAVLRDVSARKQAELQLKAVNEELIRSNQRFDIALKSTPHGLAFYDTALKLQIWNRRYEEIYDLPPGTFHTGMSFTEAIAAIAAHGKYRPTTSATAMKEHLELLRRPVKRVTRELLTDGRLVEIVHEPSPGGGCVMTVTDITEQNAREAELREAKKSAEQANRAKSQFLANMSHELRTPLNAVIGFSDIIAKELYGPLGDQRYAQYAADIGESGSHLLALLNDILDLSKIEAGRLSLVEQPANIVGVIEACLRLVRLAAQTRNITFEIKAGTSLPMVVCDEQRVRQTLLNLLTNAIKFSEPGDRIEIEAVITGDGSLSVTVADTGIGIDAEDLERVLLPFVQSDGSLQRRHEGAGLGLPIAKALIELHGGRLFLQSVPGQGTIAWFTLPAERLI